MHSTQPFNSRNWTVFLVFLRLGLTSFGGPVAHLGYFREEFVSRRRWLDDAAYSDLVALCQFLPGPASSQVGMAIGLQRSGVAGALAAWAGFTLPSAIALTLFALLASWGNAMPGGIIHGLKIVAVAIVAQAVWGMARNLCTDRTRIGIAIVAASAVLVLTGAWAQISVIALAALVGLFLLRSASSRPHGQPAPSAHQPLAIASLILFFGLLIALPVLAGASSNPLFEMVDIFYRTGALVFGGGHVVLPLLQAELVPPGWLDNDTFLAGYGAAQAVPGPLFTFSAFLGALIGPGGWVNAAVCLAAIFVPSFLLVIGVMPFWERLRANRWVQAALAGVNAAVVGLLLAALYDPVWTSAIFGPIDFALALVSLGALMFWRIPPWLVVLAGGTAGWLLNLGIYS